MATALTVKCHSLQKKTQLENIELLKTFCIFAQFTFEVMVL